MMFVIISNKKFPPTRPKNIYSMAFANPNASPHASTVLKKNKKHPIRNTPVFTIGQAIAAQRTAK